MKDKRFMLLVLLIISCLVVGFNDKRWHKAGVTPAQAMTENSAGYCTISEALGGNVGAGCANTFQLTIENKQRQNVNAPEGMVWVPGGDFSMGGALPTGQKTYSNTLLSDASPIHRVHLKSFFMDATEVTNSAFAKFVEATGYQTVAEVKLTRKALEQASGGTAAKSGDFSSTATPAPSNLCQQSRFKPGADWKHPQGPGSSISGKENYPVVNIAWQDALAYAKWAGKRLPTEAEWEFAARGGSAGALYAWGNVFNPGGKWMANTYQGKYPNHDFKNDGYSGVAPAGQYPANAYGLYDMSGNVWEWCSDWYRPDYYQTSAAKKIADNPKGPVRPYDVSDPQKRPKVLRGGSYLCSDKTCIHYMVGVRGKEDFRSPSPQIGFRCVKDID